MHFKRDLLSALLLSLASLTATGAGAPDADSAPSAQPLEPVVVEGQRTPLDSRRPEYERMLPCIGCDVAPIGEDLIRRILAYVLLPAEPVDPREFTPISLQQPRNPRADKLP